jgi:pimeloyl-ACP methyl ester carboxylesterase
MPFATCNDGVRLHYEALGSGPPVILIHGWSGSSRYFAPLVPLLEPSCRVITVDLRFHGESDKPGWGFHVARLAADLRDLLVALDLGRQRPTVLGSSLGCAVIWSYIELFGQDSLGRAIFIDQAPSQWAMPDWAHGSKGIYDAASLANIQRALLDMDAFADGNAACCLSHPLPPELAASLKRETLKCDAGQLGKLMADHAQLDWRPILPRITLPCLNLYGTESGCFPVEGTRAVGELIPVCENVAFEGCNHWLHLERPERVAELVRTFVIA